MNAPSTHLSPPLSLGVPRGVILRRRRGSKGTTEVGRLFPEAEAVRDVAEMKFPVVEDITESQGHRSICTDVRLETGGREFLELARFLHLAH